MVSPVRCDPPLSRAPRVRLLAQGRAPHLLPAGRSGADPHHTASALQLPAGFTDRLHEGDETRQQ